MVGTVSTTPANWPASLALPMAACRAITWPFIAGEISLPNSTVKAVSPQDRYRTLTSARITASTEGVSHGCCDQCRTGEHQFRSRRELRALGHGQRCRGAEDRADRKSTRLHSSHTVISYAVFCLKKKKEIINSCLLLQQPQRKQKKLT